ncbi:FirrV-1-C6 [Feldmannia irregularis virus a]|uniref:FirrV-1-C6 n=1 Tax=Feldmannia irregularis virus a TaxID=231992 RepID=Q6XLX2_9PHYC|nr:FirrV-1-C6 [Feldmannia irregularis virus a]AAR26939.1 FirrV-1-C6 [Feldmannia irregularis virus a]
MILKSTMLEITFGEGVSVDYDTVCRSIDSVYDLSYAGAYVDNNRVILVVQSSSYKRRMFPGKVQKKLQELKEYSIDKVDVCSASDVPMDMIDTIFGTMRLPFKHVSTKKVLPLGQEDLSNMNANTLQELVIDSNFRDEEEFDADVRKCYKMSNIYWQHKNTREEPMPANARFKHYFMYDSEDETPERRLFHSPSGRMKRNEYKDVVRPIVFDEKRFQDKRERVNALRRDEIVAANYCQFMNCFQYYLCKANPHNYNVWASPKESTYLYYDGESWATNGLHNYHQHVMVNRVQLIQTLFDRYKHRVDTYTKDFLQAYLSYFTLVLYDMRKIARLRVSMVRCSKLLREDMKILQKNKKTNKRYK